MTRFREQYDIGTPQGDLPDEIMSPEGYWWRWTDADKKQRPGYQVAGKAGQRFVPVGPAYERRYVEEALYCHSIESGKPCEVATHPHYALYSRRR